MYGSKPHREYRSSTRRRSAPCLPLLRYRPCRRHFPETSWECILISKSRVSLFRPALALRLALALLLVGIYPHAVRSQGTEVKIGLQRGNRTRLSLRLDDWIPSGDMGGATSAAASGLQVLQNDLTISGLFTLTGGAAPKDSLAYASFSEQAEYAVEIRASGNNLEIHARLYNLPGRSLISDKTYTSNDVQL